MDTTIALTLFCVVLGASIASIIVMWRKPKYAPPRGLNTTNNADPETFAQVMFFPLIIFNQVDILVNSYAYIGPNLTQDTFWLIVPITILISLINAILYYPIHMSMGDSKSYLNRVIGIVLIALQAGSSVYNMLYGNIILLVTFYVPFYIYSVLSISWLVYPPMWNRVFAPFERKNRKIVLGFHITAVSLLIITGFYINTMINAWQQTENLNQFFLDNFGVDLTIYNYQFLLIGTITPSCMYIATLIFNYFRYIAYTEESDKIVITNPQLLDYENARFTFVGIFVGYEIFIYSTVLWISWLIVSIMYILNLINLLGFVCKSIFMYILLPIIIVTVINEIYRTIIGLWMFGRDYRPYPRQLHVMPRQTAFNVYWEHFEYFSFFYSIIIGFRNVIGSPFTIGYKMRSIDIGYKKTEQSLLD